MALYLGSSKVVITCNDALCHLNLYTEMPILNGMQLLSFDNYILKDSNGLYLTAKESE